MRCGKSVIDADSHKFENPVIYLDYLDTAYRDRVSFVRDRFGEQRIQILDRLPDAERSAIPRLFPQPDGWGKGAYRPYHPESTIGGLFNRVRIEHMDREGIDHQVIYGSAALAFNSVSDPELGAALCRAYNDYIRDDCAPHAHRLHPAGVVSLQNPAEAVAELRRCAEDLGLVAAMLPPALSEPHPKAPGAFPELRVPKHLSHPDFLPLFEEAERLDITLGIHGAPGLQLPAGAADYLDTFTVAHAFASRDMLQMALAKLIFDGVMEAFPRLRFGFLGAGCGWLPEFLHSLREHWEKRIRDFDPAVEPSRTEFLRELVRERGFDYRSTPARQALRLLQMLFASSPDSASPEELERFRYEHPRLTRDPREYVWRGQVYLSVAPDDPAPSYLSAAMGDSGSHIGCFAVDYGNWNCALDGCVDRIANNPRIPSATADALLHHNALRFYGERLRKRIQ
jgi:predicted TIM-barrel fold metal-dependent hydrolase